MTTTPRMLTLSRTKRMASTAAWSALSLLPRPIQRAAAIAPASVTRTSSIAMLRSGACRALTVADPTSRELVQRHVHAVDVNLAQPHAAERKEHPVGAFVLDVGRRADPIDGKIAEAGLEDSPRRLRRVALPPVARNEPAPEIDDDTVVVLPLAPDIADHRAALALDESPEAHAVVALEEVDL